MRLHNTLHLLSQCAEPDPDRANILAILSLASEDDLDLVLLEEDESGAVAFDVPDPSFAARASNGTCPRGWLRRIQSQDGSNKYKCYGKDCLSRSRCGHASVATLLTDARRGPASEAKTSRSFTGGFTDSIPDQSLTRKETQQIFLNRRYLLPTSWVAALDSCACGKPSECCKCRMRCSRCTGALTADKVRRPHWYSLSAI